VRAPADAAVLGRFMAALGREAERETRVYFTGGASAVILGWRASTLDADIEVVPESDAQALAKIERGHAQDRGDVEEMLRRGLVEPARLREMFAAITPQLYRYPALDETQFRRALDEVLGR
jgi:hypothetical protein